MKKILIFLVLFNISTLFAKHIPFILKNSNELIQKKHHDQAYSMLDDAIAHCKTATEKIDVANALLNIGMYYFEQHESDKALQCFMSLLKINDNFSVAHHNIGFVYTEQLGMFDHAIPHFQKALALKPDSAATHFCYALALLSQGSLIEGFKEYEWRWHRGPKSPRNFPHYPLEKQWKGEPLLGKRILLRAEQGLGDILQFIRYAKIFHAMNAYVIAEVHEALKPLISLCPYINKVITIYEKESFFDYQIPYLSIPMIVKTTLESIPQTIPYLYTKKELCKKWHAFFAQKKSYNIGICWHGNDCHTADKFMPISYFESLAKIEHVKLFSLQKNDNRENQYDFMSYFDHHFDVIHGSFMDTAAAMQELDLVVTVDTSIAHLAGGLGVPVIVILPFPAEWRWLTKRSDSPWYPTMKLLRQTNRNNWDDVMQELIHEVTQRACKKKFGKKH